MRRGRALVLVGARGAGKTMLGVALARRLEIPFVDTDDLVEDLAGVSVADLFERDGEVRFRELEQRAIASIEPSTVQVVATGGGAVIDEANRRCLARLGRVIWLRASADELGRRIAGTRRPSLTGRPPDREIADVLASREPLYRGIADGIVETEGRSVEEMCDELQQLWRGLSPDDLR